MKKHSLSLSLAGVVNQVCLNQLQFVNVSTKTCNSSFLGEGMGKVIVSSLSTFSENDIPKHLKPNVQSFKTLPTKCNNSKVNKNKRGIEDFYALVEDGGEREVFMSSKNVSTNSQNLIERRRRRRAFFDKGDAFVLTTEKNIINKESSSSHQIVAEVHSIPSWVSENDDLISY